MPVFKVMMMMIEMSASDTFVIRLKETLEELIKQDPLKGWNVEYP